MTALDLLTNPDAFFRERADDPSLVGPAVVVVLVAVVGIAGSVPVLRTTMAAMPDEAAPFLPILLATTAVGGVTAVLFAWALYAVAFHLVSAVAYGADGSFKTTLALTGWGFVPRIPEGVLAAALTYLVFTGVVLPADPTQTAVIVGELRNDPLLRLTQVLSVVFLLWSAMLWTFAVRHGRALSLRQAAVTVAVPVGLRLGLFVLGQLGVFAGLLGLGS